MQPLQSMHREQARALTRNIVMYLLDYLAKKPDIVVHGDRIRELDVNTANHLRDPKGFPAQEYPMTMWPADLSSTTFFTGLLQYKEAMLAFSITQDAYTVRAKFPDVRKNTCFLENAYDYYYDRINYVRPEQIRWSEAYQSLNTIVTANDTLDNLYEQIVKGHKKYLALVKRCANSDIKLAAKKAAAEQHILKGGRIDPWSLTIQ